MRIIEALSEERCATVQHRRTLQTLDGARKSRMATSGTLVGALSVAVTGRSHNIVRAAPSVPSSPLGPAAVRRGQLPSASSSRARYFGSWLACGRQRVRWRDQEFSRRQRSSCEKLDLTRGRVTACEAPASSICVLQFGCAVSRCRGTVEKGSSSPRRRMMAQAQPTASCNGETDIHAVLGWAEADETAGFSAFRAPPWLDR